MKTREAQGLMIIKREKEEVKQRNGKFNFCWFVWWLYINIKLEGKDETETQRLQRERNHFGLSKEMLVSSFAQMCSVSGQWVFFLVRESFFSF